jgi:hypothetical protein
VLNKICLKQQGVTASAPATGRKAESFDRTSTTVIDVPSISEKSLHALERFVMAGRIVATKALSERMSKTILQLFLRSACQ